MLTTVQSPSVIGNNTGFRTLVSSCGWVIDTYCSSCIFLFSIEDVFGEKYFTENMPLFAPTSVLRHLMVVRA